MSLGFGVFKLFRFYVDLVHLWDIFCFPCIGRKRILCADMFQKL